MSGKNNYYICILVKRGGGSLKILETRHSARLAPIFTFNCEFFLFVYIVKQKQKKFADFVKKFVDFENLLEIKFCWKLIFEILIIHKPFLGSCEVPQKIWAGLFQPF